MDTKKILYYIFITNFLRYQIKSYKYYVQIYINKILTKFYHLNYVKI